VIPAPAAVSAFVLALAAISIAYTAFALLRVATFSLEGVRGDGSAPSISVLKPLDGIEPQLEENVRTFCEQTYPRFEVIFCAQDPNDPALDAARAVARRYPQRSVAVVAGGGPPLRNPKIANLQAAMPLVTGEIVLISDSDMRVRTEYLQRVAEAFADERVGAATTLYAARAVDAFVARLGALYVNDQFTPSVLVATALQPLRFCFGATMAVRASVLAEIGGLRALGATIADDYALGDLVAKAGYRVALASEVPATLVTETALADLLAREIRWARTIRAVRPLGYAGSVVAFPLLFGALAVVFARPLALSLALFAAAVALRVALHVAAHRALRVEGPARPWLVPLREALSVAVWCAGLFGSRGRWRRGGVSVRANGC
jgi:ceramide glucosyltransferase